MALQVKNTFGHYVSQHVKKCICGFLTQPTFCISQILVCSLNSRNPGMYIKKKVFLQDINREYKFEYFVDTMWFCMWVLFCSVDLFRLLGLAGKWKQVLQYVF
eukprot:TRINITY_DN11771_c0_g1_i1.p4 TRINITY_DN11771_c0_g1~~TRINITY_DN11771_c0_g1_i1.p4  ORF type:complete len:103 (-),score=1.64 TRINITY_DN11771_c0_g1_i1:42-350(-)